MSQSKPVPLAELSRFWFIKTVKLATKGVCGKDQRKKELKLSVAKSQSGRTVVHVKIQREKGLKRRRG